MYFIVSKIKTISVNKNNEQWAKWARLQERVTNKKISNFPLRWAGTKRVGNYVHRDKRLRLHTFLLAKTYSFLKVSLKKLNKQLTSLHDSTTDSHCCWVKPVTNMVRHQEPCTNFFPIPSRMVVKFEKVECKPEIEMVHLKVKACVSVLQ